MPTSDTINMIRPHMRHLPRWPMPEGYTLQGMTAEDIGLWTDIWRDAEPYNDIKDDLFRREFGDDPAVIAERCFLLYDPRGLGIGAISAWYNPDFRGEEFGRIHWVAIRPSCQGKGLAKAMMTFALNQLVQWHDKCYLVTHARRIGAVKIYLDCGFEPDLVPPGARELWRQVNQTLHHPLLDKALADA